MTLTEVENIANDGTKLRLIDRADWYRFNTRHVSLAQLFYIDFCTVPFGVAEVMAKLRREGYHDLGDIDGIVYVVIPRHDGYDEVICHHLAEDFFGVDALIVPHVAGS